MSAPDLLAAIVAAARRAVEVRQEREPVASLERRLTRRCNGRAFLQALRDGPEPRVIAECKRRSPSKGILRRDYEPVAHAKRYEQNGAAAISVLTEPTFFDGRPEHLRAVREVVRLPLLRKDFIVTEYQIVETAVLGADAVLLIVGALADADLRRAVAMAGDLGLAALVEVHTRDELARALEAGASILGVNSRNLRTLTVDPGLLAELAPQIPQGVVAVAESGISSSDDLARLGRLGYRAFLVGERLIVQPDPGSALRDLRAVSSCG